MSAEEVVVAEPLVGPVDLLVFFSFIGALAYWFFVHRKKSDVPKNLNFM